LRKVKASRAGNNRRVSVKITTEEKFGKQRKTMIGLTMDRALLIKRRGEEPPRAEVRRGKKWRKLCTKKNYQRFNV